MKKYSTLVTDIDKNKFIQMIYDHIVDTAKILSEEDRIKLHIGEIALNIYVDFTRYCDYKILCNLIRSSSDSIKLHIGEIALNIYVDFTRYCDYKILCKVIDLLFEYKFINYVWGIIHNLFFISHDDRGNNLFEKIKYIINKCPELYKNAIHEAITCNFINVSDNDLNRIEIDTIYYMFMKGYIDQSYINNTFEDEPYIDEYENRYKLRSRKQYIMFI